MSNVRKLMCRLNPSTVRYDVGQGGKPELTAQDIAAALGMVPDVYARDIFTAIWWENGRTQESIGRVRTALLREYSRRCRAYEIAKLDLHIFECEAAALGKGKVTRADHSAGQRRREVHRLAHDARWPWSAAAYPAMVVAVLDEIGNPDRCSECGGRGEVDGFAGVKKQCTACTGGGHAPLAKRQRAHRIGVTESSYRGAWFAPYEWLVEHVAERERDVARKLRDILDTRGVEAA